MLKQRGGRREHVRGLVQWDWALSAGEYKYQAVAVWDARHWWLTFQRNRVISNAFMYIMLIGSVGVENWAKKSLSRFQRGFSVAKHQQDPSVGEVFQQSSSCTASSVSVGQFKLSLLFPHRDGKVKFWIQVELASFSWRNGQGRDC